MKDYIKKKFPLIVDLYRNSPYYKKRLLKNQLLAINSKKIQMAQESEILSSVFNNQLVVKNGPFAGMKYINKSSCSTLLPKILGSYEEPIQIWIEEIINSNKYSRILDIGCAEGYYACGFALTLPNAEIIGYDVDPEARKSAAELKSINNLKNIVIKSECTNDELNRLCNPGTLVFCDIEGFEDLLLDPIKSPNLKNADILVESHDFYIPNLTDSLISRFYLTHTMRIIIDYPYRLRKYNFPNIFSTDQFNFIIDEKRPRFMKFIFMKSNNGEI